MILKILHFVLFVSSCVLVADASVRSLNPQKPSTAMDAGWENRHLGKLAVAATNRPNVVFIGDSGVHGWEYSGKAAFNRYFRKYGVLNLGFSGDRTENVLWRLTAGGELDGYEAKCIVLLIGTNNARCRRFEEEPPVDTILGIREILRVIRSKQPKARTILTAIFPYGRQVDDPVRKRNDVVNNEIAKFADGDHIIWCDVNDKFVDGAGCLIPDIFSDFLDPDARGYEIWASVLQPLVDRVLKDDRDNCIPSVWPSRPVGYPFEREAPLRPAGAFGQNDWWDKDVLLEHRNQIVDGTGEYDIVWVGDSITHRWSRPGVDGCDLWQKLGERYRMLNLGVGGDKVQHALWRLENGELEGYRAKCFTVMIGTNNSGRNVEAVAAAVRKVIDVICRKHPESKVILMPIFPRNADPRDSIRGANEKINCVISRIPDGERVFWLDFNDRFLKPGGVLTSEFMLEDLVHPNKRGYEVWVNAISPAFREILGW